MRVGKSPVWARRIGSTIGLSRLEIEDGMCITIDRQTGFQSILRPADVHLHGNIWIQDILYIVDMQRIQNGLFFVFQVQSIKVAGFAVVLKNDGKICVRGRAFKCNGVADDDYFAEMGF